MGLGQARMELTLPGQSPTEYINFMHTARVKVWVQLNVHVHVGGSFNVQLLYTADS